MGINRFYAWLKLIGYHPKARFCFPPQARLLVDARLYMIRCAWSLPPSLRETDASFASDLASAVAKTLRSFKCSTVILVHDGKSPDLKAETSTKRAREQEKRTQRLERLQDDEQEKRTERPQDDELESAQRAARGVCSQTARSVLAHLEREFGFSCVQCSGEADPVLASMAREQENSYVLSEDSDLLGLYGVPYLVRSDGALYNTKDILETAGISLQQMQEMACLSGCDFTPGVRGIAFPTAHKLMLQHGSAEAILTSLETRKKFVVPENFRDRLASILQLLRAPTAGDPTALANQDVVVNVQLHTLHVQH